MRLPSSKDRIAVVGRTGSGKTVGAVWHLSHANYLSMPWIVFNHKRDKLVDSIPGAQFLELNEFPKKPGIYIYTPRPEIDDEIVDEILYKAHARTHVGIYIDEGYMIKPRSSALNTVYTQGRSLHLATITLSQRPANVSRFAFSEADFFQIYDLTDDRDIDILRGYVKVPTKRKLHDIVEALPKYHAIYYDVGAKNFSIMQPVPHEDIILQTFEDRFKQSSQKIHLI